MRILALHTWCLHDIVYLNYIAHKDRCAEVDGFGNNYVICDRGRVNEAGREVQERHLQRGRRCGCLLNTTHIETRGITANNCTAL